MIKVLLRILKFLLIVFQIHLHVNETSHKMLCMGYSNTLCGKTQTQH